MLQPARRHQLHANANAEKRPCALGAVLFDGLPHAIDGAYTIVTIPIGTNAGQNQAVSLGNLFRCRDKINGGTDV
jgi:hypothetical protein